MAAIELIHKQPVRWTKEKVVACDGGGGPLGHPKIFINTDKPQIAVCGYCGLPFVCLDQEAGVLTWMLTLYRLTSVIVNTSNRCPLPATPLSRKVTRRRLMRHSV